MNYPNKTYVLETVKELKLSTETIKRKHIVIVVADNVETATQHLKDKLGFDGVLNELIWLMGCDHATMYIQDGSKPLDVQAKIMYNTTASLKE